jgi:hypothetical protein
MKKLAALVVAVACVAHAAYAEPSVFPTGVTIYDPAKAYNTYVIYGGTDHKTYLIDMDGNEVRTWNYAGFPSGLIDPALTGGVRGHVLVQLSTDDRPGAGVVPHMPAEFRNRSVGELDWDGKIVWKWGENAPGGAARQHHDWRRLPNGDTLFLVNFVHPVAGFKLPRILDDAIYEVSPKGEIVWKWLASEHLDELGFTPSELALLRASASPDYLHVNNMVPLGPNRWFEGGDLRFAPDNILFDSRNANVSAIIDRKTGKIVWTLGPDYPPIPPNATPLPHPVDQISGQHDVHLIEEGLPGAGNLIVFDNQGEGGYPPAALGVTTGSRVLEIDPVTKEIVWQYSAESSGRPGWSFFSSFISSARRLPNGNTLIDEGMNGRVFQVTKEGRIVWEYVSPHFATSPVGATVTSVTSNWIYRATPVPYDWVPAGTPHAEKAVVPPDLSSFHVPQTP